MVTAERNHFSFGSSFIFLLYINSSPCGSALPDKIPVAAALILRKLWYWLRDILNPKAVSFAEQLIYVQHCRHVERCLMAFTYIKVPKVRVIANCLVVTLHPTCFFPLRIFRHNNLWLPSLCKPTSSICRY